MASNCTIYREDWLNCYGQKWGQTITPESYSHPAKMARGLVYRIYQHLLSEGYIKPGDTVLDPFAGIGGTCCDAMANGLNWLGQELEQRFVDMGAGCDCTGISKEDWVRFYGRWDRANYKDGRHWCPRCLAEVKHTVEGKDAVRARGQMAMFAAPPSASYVRGSGQIPFTQPHRYTGNLELFRRYAKKGTAARLIQGDSRFLRRTLIEAGGLDTSPPYSTGEKGHPSLGSVNKDNWGSDRRDITGRRGVNGDYGESAGQLATLSEGDVDAIIGSPPYADGCTHTGGVDPNPEHIQGGKRGAYGIGDGYGQSDGQLSLLPPGDLDALISSPMFAGNSGGRGEASREGIDPALFDRHSGGMVGGVEGDPANVGMLPVRGFEEVLGALDTSAPFGDQMLSHDNFTAPHDTTKRMDTDFTTSYGSTEGQLGVMPEGDYDALVSSTPFVDSVGSDDPETRGGLYRDPKRRKDASLTATYGATEGQLGTMAEGDYGALVSSAPFEDSLDRGTVDARARVSYARQNGVSNAEHISPIDMEQVGERTQTYGITAGQLGADSGETFWQAALIILRECYAILKGGGEPVPDGDNIDFCNC